MRVATYQDIRTIALEERAEPAAGPADVVLTVGACGVCGTDVHTYLEGAWAAPGDALGHEYAGTVVEVGEHVVGISVGDRLAVNPMRSCGTCERCRRGRANLCAAPQGAMPGFADRALVPSAELGRNVFRLPPDLSMEAAAFLEPMSVAMRAIRSVEPDLSEPLLVVGLGSIGQCVVQILVAQGARMVVGVDTSPVRREAATRSGAHSAFDPKEPDLVGRLIDHYGQTSSPYRPVSGAFGVAFECAGAQGVLAQLADLVRADGSISLIAATAGPISIDPTPFVQKEIHLHGSFAYTPDDCAAAFELIASKQVEPTAIISHRFSLSEVAEAFATQSKSDSSVKVVVCP